MTSNIHQRPWVLETSNLIDVRHHRNSMTEGERENGRGRKQDTGKGLTGGRRSRVENSHFGVIKRERRKREGRKKERGREGGERKCEIVRQAGRQKQMKKNN